MILSDLLSVPVRDVQGHRIGEVIDARFAIPADIADRPADARLVGFIVGRHTRSSFGGYERTKVNSPWLIARFLAWRHRGSFLVLWEDVERLSPEAVRLRRGYHRHPSDL
ncbi:MAG TPA: PRC-barrel domain containing protein [Lacisediminihabitans sp.]|uniref:PRC-barrel domain containing protein n=1 Tax=Lacisediminihabitans sp. TaxID=2787631 RepID=UPI002EDBAC5F